MASPSLDYVPFVITIFIKPLFRTISARVLACSILTLLLSVKANAQTVDKSDVKEIVTNLTTALII